MLACTILCLLAAALADQGKMESRKPLVFEFDQDDAHRVKIYWDPSVGVKKIKEISSRDVHYVINNATGKVREEYSPWLLLVTEQDDVDAARRLLFVKSDMCVEQDYRVSWYDSNALLHENITQRMEPSPEPWKPSAKIDITNLRYDATVKRILGTLSWAMSDEKLRGIPKLGQLHPTVTLESCKYLFQNPVALPVVDSLSKVVSFDPLYAKHQCSFTVRLRQMTYKGELECRSLRQTSDDLSDRIEMSCTQGLNYPECKDQDDQQPCPMSCDQSITAVGDYDWSRGYARPFVNIQWASKGQNSKPAVSHLLRYSQVDAQYNNYPLEEFNTTFVEVNGTISNYKLEPFSNDEESFYTFQICTLYEACFATAKWSSVPKVPIYATSIVQKLPVLTTTTVIPSTRGNDFENITGENATRRAPRSPLDQNAWQNLDTTMAPHANANALILDGFILILCTCFMLVF